MSRTRPLGDWHVPALGLGCMNLSHAYGSPPSAQVAENVLARALELGIRHFDSAALYGFGRNEELVGPVLAPFRKEIVLVSKCGMRGENGVRTIDGKPEKLRQDLEDSLRRLKTDVIDLYYLHRYDKQTPIEDSVGEMGRFVEQGKVRAIGLSEVSASTLRAAHAEYPITAVQSEYSLWSRNVELKVLAACKELGISFVAFSPLGRGFLTGVDLLPDTFEQKDIRAGMPRFQEPHFSQNRVLLNKLRRIAQQAGCTLAQLALAWVLSRGDNIHVIPGTTSTEHLEEDWEALDIDMTEDISQALSEVMNATSVSGPRYPEHTQKETDTEEFAM